MELPHPHSLGVQKEGAHRRTKHQGVARAFGLLASNVILANSRSDDNHAAVWMPIQSGKQPRSADLVHGFQLVIRAEIEGPEGQSAVDDEFRAGDIFGQHWRK